MIQPRLLGTVGIRKFIGDYTPGRNITDFLMPASNDVFECKRRESILYIILRKEKKKTPDKYATTVISRTLCDQRSEPTKMGDVKVCRNIGLEPVHFSRKG